MSKESLLLRAKALKLYGVIAHWEEIAITDWIESLINWEEEIRSNKSLERRLQSAHLGRFKALTLFDWNWPKKCDREAIEDLMQLNFFKEATNIILCGPNGVGKSTIACNIAHQAILQGHTVLFTTAGQMLKELASKDGAVALNRWIKYYAKPQLLVIDELGYLSYTSTHADLLFNIIAQRYEKNSTIVTTNKSFGEWGEIFPNASCVVSLIDRLVHRSEIINIEADSFRLKEAKEQTAIRMAARAVKLKTKITASQKTLSNKC